MKTIWDMFFFQIYIPNFDSIVFNFWKGSFSVDTKCKCVVEFKEVFNTPPRRFWNLVQTSRNSQICRLSRTWSYVRRLRSTQWSETRHHAHIYVNRLLFPADVNIIKFKLIVNSSLFIDGLGPKYGRPLIGFWNHRFLKVRPF